LGVDTGDTLQFDQVRYATIASGRLVATRAGVLVGRDLGTLTLLTTNDYYSSRFPRGTWQYAAGATVEYLQYRAELTCFVRFEGRVVDASRCPIADTSFSVLSEPVVEFWVRVIVNKEPVGWVLVDDRQVKVVGRRF